MSRRTPTRFRDALFVPPSRFEDGQRNQEWHETERERSIALAEHWRTEGMKKEVSGTGVTRARLRTQEAQTAVGALNRRMDEAFDEVRAALSRESLARQGGAAERSADASRSSALRERGV